MNATPIKEVLADASHPAHEAAKEIVRGLDAGEINMCACMGPVYGEPFCSCEMGRRGLGMSVAHKDAMKATEERFKAFFGAKAGVEE